MTVAENLIAREEHDQKMIIELERMLRIKNRFISDPEIKDLGSSKDMNTNYKKIKKFLDAPSDAPETQLIKEINLLEAKLAKLKAPATELIPAAAIKYYAMPLALRRTAKKRNVLKQLPIVQKDTLSENDLAKIKEILAHVDSTVVRYRVLETYGQKKLQAILSDLMQQPVSVEVNYESKPNFYVEVVSYTGTTYRMAVPELPIVKISITRDEKNVDKIQIA